MPHHWQLSGRFGSIFVWDCQLPRAPSPPVFGNGTQLFQTCFRVPPKLEKLNSPPSQVVRGAPKFSFFLRARGGGGHGAPPCRMGRGQVQKRGTRGRVLRGPLEGRPMEPRPGPGQGVTTLADFFPLQFQKRQKNPKRSDFFPFQGLGVPYWRPAHRKYSCPFSGHPGPDIGQTHTKNRFPVSQGPPT